jgi:hypothetical protein
VISGEAGSGDMSKISNDKAITEEAVSNSLAESTAQAFGSNSLADLRERLKAEHFAVGKALKTGLAHAMTAGDILIEAKMQLGQHGAWLPWLESCGLSERTSQRYMRLARNRTSIEANPSGVSDLGIRGALALLAVPRKWGTCEVTDGMIDLTDHAAESAFDLWDGSERRGADQPTLRKALLAEARAALDRLAELATTPELVKIIEDASGDFCERLTAACAEFRAAVGGETGLSEAELDDLEAEIARCKTRGGDQRDIAGLFLAGWKHLLDRDPWLPEGSATAVVFRVRDIATEWARHIEMIVREDRKRGVEEVRG